MVEINEYLKSFPNFQADQELHNDEIMDIAELGMPNSWQKQMVLQGFDPLAKSTDEFIEFCEQLESIEQKEQPKKMKKQIDKLSDSRMIGYGAMLGEGSLALASTLAAVAGIGLVGACALPTQGAVDDLTSPGMEGIPLATYAAWIMGLAVFIGVEVAG